MHKQTERTRSQAMQQWLQQTLGTAAPLVKLAGDASMRHYYRVNLPQGSYVVMDAPPQQENCNPYLKIAHIFKQLGLLVPTIHAADTAQGFLLITDFGDQLYLDALTHQPSIADSLYQQAFDNLIKIQTHTPNNDYSFPPFSADLLLQEMNLFYEWYLCKLCGIQCTTAQQKTINDLFQILIEEALSQPQVCAHRDFHSRNLMVVADDQVGILDFQDAVWGAITYDLVSLLRDCYVDWPQHQVEQWVQTFRQQALQSNILQNDNPQQFMRWFDWMGVQRHLKCLGIFARLNLRDNKPQYLQYIPRILAYIHHVSLRYSELHPFAQLLETLNLGNVDKSI